MNGINAKAIFVAVFGLSLGLYIMVDVLLARTSSLGELYLFMAIAALIFGAVSPKPAMYLLILCTGYIDVFKRLMVVGGNPTQLDVAYILAIPPLLVAGSIMSVFLGMTFGQGSITKDKVVSLAVSFLVVAVTVVGTFNSDEATDSGGRTASAVVNQGFYSFLFFTIPVLFPTSEDKRKLLQFSFVSFIPAVFYMFQQRAFGYADFEYRYLMTGLTIEAKNLWETLGQVRCFSTFNGAGAASTLLSMYILYCFVPLRPGNAKPTVFQRIGKWCLAPLFAAAAYFTIVRTGWFSGIGSIAAYALLGSKFRARLGILVGVGSFALLVATAPFILRYNMLQKTEAVLQEIVLQSTNDPTLKRAVVLGTAMDRVRGWANLTEEPRLWQPFGFAAAGFSSKGTTTDQFHWGHDALIDSLIKFGYIPVFVGLVGATYLFSRLFKFMYGLPRNALEFKTTRLCLALFVGILIGAMSSGAQFRNFPQNLFCALWLAIPFSTYQEAARAKRLAAQQPAQATATPSAPEVPGMPVPAQRMRPLRRNERPSPAV